jgi:large subunit ribosomal protein L13
LNIFVIYNFERRFSIMRTTFIAKPAEIERKWYVVDAADQTLGRLASEVASVLRGKNKPIYTPHCDTGDYVIIVNADKIKVTGKKLDQKLYRRHTGHVGGLKEATLREMLDKKPEEVIKHAVKGMLPKNALGREMFGKLFVYAGSDHKHQAQCPEVLEIKY